MYCTAFFSGVGAIAGVGFGIYVATQNFNPDAHQAESMSHANRVFSELLTQVGYIGLQSGSLAFFSSVAGAIIDSLVCLTYACTCQCNRLEKERLRDNITFPSSLDNVNVAPSTL